MAADDPGVMAAAVALCDALNPGHLDRHDGKQFTPCETCQEEAEAAVKACDEARGGHLLEAAREVVRLWGAEDENWIRPEFDAAMAALRMAVI